MPTRRHREIERGPPRADAIVVLGCLSSAQLARRVERGVELYRAGAAPLLLLSGGGRGPVPEALVMRDLALARGVPSPALLLEPVSLDTVDNARRAAELLAVRGLGSAILVSDRTHLPRAALLLRLAGIEVTGRSGVRRQTRRSELAAAIREAAALPWSLWRARRRRV